MYLNKVFIAGNLTRDPEPAGAAGDQHHRGRQDDLGFQIAAPRRADAEGALFHHHGRQPFGRQGHRRTQGRKPGSASAAELFLRAEPGAVRGSIFYLFCRKSTVARIRTGAFGSRSFSGTNAKMI